MPNTAMPAEDNADRPPFVGGRNAIAMGTASKALADRASALGAGSPALERDATAVGRDAVAIGTPAVEAGGVATMHDDDGSALSSAAASQPATLPELPPPRSVVAPRQLIC
ncbi:hypothetical protein LN533_14880 [Xanthomonas vesicatoria]|uniref:Trimeric autotransporter adhesin YadA-like head domain-containing protein n=3 Tax=Xanthomonas vesicatoria TaxID=56460 RepID=A0ABS8LBV1_9XANT|nr:hypothetical protein [Xanthomonas vesicatoria]KHM92102.1 hypothetical protein OR60_17655 [Xanthomonas vesicatoria]MCC8622657.1 hypothetical protein [Xanthomonas vesicatoria]MCC8703487.1 hypothetical protein [Xanthomonas vesicatoria]